MRMICGFQTTAAWDGRCATTASQRTTHEFAECIASFAYPGPVVNAISIREGAKVLIITFMQLSADCEGHDHSKSNASG